MKLKLKLKKRAIIIIGVTATIVIVAATLLILKNRTKEGPTQIPNDKECTPISGGGYTLYFQTNGGNKIDSMHICIACSPDSYEKIPSPTKEGDTFEGWYYDKSFKKKVTETSTLDIKPLPKTDNNGCSIGYKDITIYAKWSSSKSEDNQETVSPSSKYYCADGSTPSNGYCTRTETINANVSYSCPDGLTLVDNKCRSEDILPATGGVCPANSSYSVVEDYCIETTKDDDESCAAKGGYNNGTSCIIDRGRPSQYVCQGEAAGWELIDGNVCRTYYYEDANPTYSCPSGYNLNGSQCSKTTTTRALKK